MTVERIRWTGPEYEVIGREIATILREGEPSRLRAANTAQARLPIERRRKFVTWSGVSVKRLNQIIDFHLRADEQALRRAEADATPAPIADAPAASAPTKVEHAAPPPPTLSPPTASIEDALVGACKRIILRVLHDPELRAAVVSALGAVSGHTEAMPPHNPQPTVSAGRRLPRVLIAGLIAQQITEIKVVFSSRVDLRFWTTDQKVSALHDMARGCDFAIGCVGFMPHPADKALLGSGVKYLRNSNGVSTVKALIEQELGLLANA